jgi:methyl-accepting chemotaxis protein
MNIKDLKISTRLSVGFGLLLFFLLTLGAFTLIRLNGIESDIARVANDRFPKVVQSYTIIDQLNTVARALRNMLLLQDNAKILQEDARIDEAARVVKENLAKLQESMKTDEDKKLLSELVQAREGYVAVQSQTRQEIKSGRKAEAMGLIFGNLRAKQTAYFEAIGKLIETQKGMTETDAKGSLASAANIKSAVWWLSSVAVIAGILLAIVVIRSITGPVSEATAIAQHLARGETSVTFSEFTKDETGSMLRSMREMVDAIQRMSVDADVLSKAAVEGRLDTRADASKHQGDYRKIVQGVNDTLDSVINPVNEVMRVMAGLEQGDLTSSIQQEYQGKLQQLRNAVNNTVKKLSDTVAEIGHGANTLASSAEELTATSASMATGAEQMTHQANTAAAATEQATVNVKNMAAGIEQISSNSNTVASASEEVSVNLNTVGAAVEQVSSNMKVVATTSERMTMAVNSVATAIEEMSVSLNEVAKSSGQAANVASRAAMNAGNAAQIVEKLGKSAQEIGKVVDMIKGIAAQTNLLALNATIEAASAGEAGKGFAVVANEVKELAKQTASATEDIRAQVEGMQGNTAQVVKAIDEIVQIINQINDISGTIAAAVEEQTATTNEISKNVGEAARGANDVAKNVQQAAAGANEVSRNVQEAAKGVGEIARNINQLAAGTNDVARNAGEAAKGMNDVSKNVILVSSQAKNTTQGAGDTNNAAKELARLAERLQSAVKKFKL